MRLLVIVPSRGRPASIRRLWEAWEATADGRADLLVCLDEDDPTLDEYLLEARGPWYKVAPRNGFAPRLTAEAVEAAPLWDALASWGDDHLPVTGGWDTALCDALAEMGTGFAYGDDRIQGERLPTACAMTSDVVTTLGWMTPPGFAHLYVDRVWYDLGEAIGRRRYLPEVVIEHLHPLHRDDIEADELVLEANTPEAFRADKAAYRAFHESDFAGCVEKLRGLL